MQLPRTLAALVAAGLAAGCPGGDSGYPHANLLLPDLADEARIEARSPWVPPSGTRASGCRGGVVLLELPLRWSAGARLDGGLNHLWVWRLPFPLSQDVQGESFGLRLEGLALERVVLGGGAPEAVAAGTGGFEVLGNELWIALPTGAAPPEEFRLAYPIYAAHLVGSGLLDGVPTAEVARARRIWGDSAVDSLVLPTGGTLRLSLPELAAGRFRCGYSAEFEDDPQGVRIRVSVGGERLDAIDLARGGLRGADSAVPVGPVDAGELFEVEVDGPPGGLVFLEAPLLSRPRREGDPPNVLFVLVDTLRADRVGAVAGERGLSPEMDRLAADSLVFDQCWSTCSWTLPSVASILTSNHGGQHQAWLNDRRLGRGLDTLAEVLRRGGYLPVAVTDGVFLSQSFGLDRGFLRFEAFDPETGGIVPVLARARELLDEVGDGPWFLFVHTYEVHSPYHPPEWVAREILERHPEAPLDKGAEPHPYFEEIERDPARVELLAPVLEELYDAGVAFAEGELGSFLNELRARGLYDPSLIVLTSDHGEEFGEHGLLGHADTLYAEQLHVPLLLHLPGGERAGEVVSTPVSQIDLAPTVLDVVGLEEELAATDFIGVSLLSGAQPSPVYASRNHQELGLLQALRESDRVWIEGRYHLRRPTWPGGEPEVYELADDPFQARNLFPANPDRYAPLGERCRAASMEYGKARTSGFEARLDARTLQMLGQVGYFAAGDQDG